jgi:hypothetical protein
MLEPANSLIVSQIAILLTCYGFELRGYTIPDLIEQWLQQYQVRWIRLAVVEALYQGRYKTISVEQILKLWLRRGQPTYHFTHDFERLICQKLPRDLAIASRSVGETLDEARSFVMPNQNLAQLSERSLLGAIDPEILPDLSVLSAPETLPAAEINARLEAQLESVTDFEQLTLEAVTQTNLATAFSTPVFQEDTASWIEASKRSIHQFIPVSDNSELYAKLRAVVKQGLEPGG